MTNTIVCFSLNAPPLNNAEAFCTARFINALSQQGIKIHLVTINHPQQLDESIVDELLDDKIIITRLSLPSISNRRSTYIKVKHLFFAEYSEYIDFFVNEIKNILKLYNKPLLLTRGWPPASNVVGYYLSQYCSKWIAHFGDPYPGFGIYSRRTIIFKYADLNWAKKIFNKADLITVTCRNAIKHFNISLNKDYSNKMHVTYHIGEPPLKHDKSTIHFEKDGLIFSHVGYWSGSRYMSEVLDEFNSIENELPNINLIQFGKIENTSYAKLKRDFKWLKIKADKIVSPRDSNYILSNTDINIIIDQNDNLDYCPYLASKFAYAVWSNKPILAVGQIDSEMSKLAQEYKSIYFSNIREHGELANKIKLINKHKDELKLPSEDLKLLFSKKDVAEKFINRIKDI